MRKILLASLVGMCWAATASAQTPVAQADTVRAPQPAVNKAGANVAPAEGDGEIDLEAIEIQAVVEKPNVDIISKRSKPEWEETRFIDRSFDAELKQAPKDLMLVDDELDRTQKLDALKKTDPPPKK